MSKIVFDDPKNDYGLGDIQEPEIDIEVSEQVEGDAYEEQSDKTYIYNAKKKVPIDMLTTITGGRLNGFTNINPQWRYQALTELFGSYGIGWGVSDVKYNYYPATNQEVAVNCIVKFWYRDPKTNQRSEDVYGVGGSKIVEKAKDYLYLNDEAEKMAFTDALSVCTKMLGIASDIYSGHKDDLTQNRALSATYASRELGYVPAVGDNKYDTQAMPTDVNEALYGAPKPQYRPTPKAQGGGKEASEKQVQFITNLINDLVARGATEEALATIVPVDYQMQLSSSRASQIIEHLRVLKGSQDALAEFINNNQ